VGVMIYVRDCENRLDASEIEMEKPRVLKGYVEADYAEDLNQ